MITKSVPIILDSNATGLQKEVNEFLKQEFDSGKPILGVKFSCSPEDDFVCAVYYPADTGKELESEL